MIMDYCKTCGKARNKQVISTRVRSGYREGLGYFRSAWEANIARYLNLLKNNGTIKDWQYESKRFYFDNIKRGTQSYLPDFQVFFNDRIEWWEVKGYWSKKGKTAVKRFKKYYPEEILKLIERKEYLIIQKEYGETIGGWEFTTR